MALGLPRIAVIGAGIIGAAIAFRLAEKGANVLLLDRAAPASGTTSGSYAWVNANEKVPREYFALNAAAMEEYRRLAWRLAPAFWYHADGNLICFRDPARIAELASRVERLRDWGYAADLVPATTVIADLEPGLAGGTAGQVAEIGWFPQEGWVEAIAMTERLVEATRNAGGRVLTGPEREVVAIGMAGGRVDSVTLREGQTIPVSAVVNAAGPNAAQIAGMVGRNLPLAGSPGLVVRARMPDGENPLQRPVETDAVGVRPDGPGQVLLALDAGDVTELVTTPLGPLPVIDPLVCRIMAWGAELVPALAAAEPYSAIVSMRPIPADGYPSVGAVGSIPGYYEAVTHSGVTLAPLIGRSLADEIQGREPEPLLDPFRAKRWE
jgi:glycine/D-amino acid oxidase-like deaminating enzyme